LFLPQEPSATVVCASQLSLFFSFSSFLLLLYHKKVSGREGGYVVFLPVGTGPMVMGDLVLTEDEVNPVISQLQQGTIQQTALHNHLLFETPQVMYLHIGGQSDPVQLAHAIHAACC